MFGSAVLLSLEFIFPIFFWLVAAFRADRAPADVQLLNDLGWIPFVGLIETAFVMIVAMGVLMLKDERTTPVFPRWGGYFNLWAALLVTPGSITVFFHDGPLAWNGMLAWYIPVTVFGIWVCVNSYLVLMAIRHQEANEGSCEARHRRNLSFSLMHLLDLGSLLLAILVVRVVAAVAATDARRLEIGNLVIGGRANGGLPSAARGHNTPSRRSVRTRREALS